MTRSLEPFVGAGGLALGASRAGFSHWLVADRDHRACETIRHNRRRGVEHVVAWRLREGDVRGLDYRTVPAGIELLATGPPCQPFSIGGKRRGPGDARDMFAEVVRALRATRPLAILVENAGGLARGSFRRYLGHILLRLAHPDIGPRQGEDWSDHLARLERHDAGGGRDGLHYRVWHRVLDAADHGVAQRRERVVIVGFRADLGLEWSFPAPTRSRDALLRDQWVTGEYWERHRIAKRRRPEPPAIARALADRPAPGPPVPSLPWRTVRDAIHDLPAPRDDEDGPVPNHRRRPGARTYPGHTGSALDWPAKTLKAGGHGVPGGENTVVLDDGSARYLTAREAARLQTFPDDYAFSGPWTAITRQIGNAMPVLLAEIVASGIRARLLDRNFLDMRAQVL